MTITPIGGDNTLASNIPALPNINARYLTADYTILITDANLVVQGDPLDDWTSLQATLRWKEPGSGQVVIPAHQYVRSQIAPGNRIVIIRRLYGTSHILIAGPIEEILRERADNGDNGGVGIYTITFADDMSWLGARFTYPDPSSPAARQASLYWLHDGNPVDAMYRLVDQNAGPGALAARRVPKLIMGSSPSPTGVKTVRVSTRLEKVTDVLRTIATNGVGADFNPDSLGFTVTQQGSNLVFDVVRSTYRGKEVIFSFNKGNLQYYSFDITAPEVTVPLVGGQISVATGTTAGNVLDARFNEFPTTDADNLAWGRYESYEAYAGSADPSELQGQATTALAQHGQSAKLASNASDTPDQRFGVHYNVGDIVALELETGEFITNPVQTVSVQAYPTSNEYVGVTIGSQAARYDASYVRVLRRLDNRVGGLERQFAPTSVSN